MKRTPLERRTPLKAVPFVAKPRPPGFSAQVKRLAWTLYGGVCACCGTPLSGQIWDMQHRWARMAGGCTHPLINSAANACPLLRSCHERCERRDTDMEERGFFIRPHYINGLPDYELILRTPMRLWNGRVARATEDGRLLYEPPEDYGDAA